VLFTLDGHPFVAHPLEEGADLADPASVCEFTPTDMQQAGQSVTDTCFSTKGASRPETCS
jgi:hypothetical protein